MMMMVKTTTTTTTAHPTVVVVPEVKVNCKYQKPCDDLDDNYDCNINAEQQQQQNSDIVRQQSTRMIQQYSSSRIVSVQEYNLKKLQHLPMYIRLFYTVKTRRRRNIVSSIVPVLVFIIICFHNVSISLAALYIPNYHGISTNTTTINTNITTDNTTNTANATTSTGSTGLISYNTLPALFGRYMVDNRKYYARVQYWPENPYLCSKQPHTSFRHSVGISIPTHTSTSTSTSSHNNSNTSNSNKNNINNGEILIPGDPIVLLVARGNCPFSQKAINVQAIDPQIMFLAIYNFDDTLIEMYPDTVSSSSSSTTINPFYYDYNLNDDNTNVNVDTDTTTDSVTTTTDDHNTLFNDPLSSSSSTTTDTSSSSSDLNLVVFSISHSAGQAIKHYIANQTTDVLENGGPQIQLDTIRTQQDGDFNFNNSTTGGSQLDFTILVLSAFGFLFFSLSCIGCIITFVLSFGQIRIVNINGRTVIFMSTGNDHNDNNNTNVNNTTNNIEIVNTFNEQDGTMLDGSSTSSIVPATTGSVFNFIAGNPRRLLTMDEVRQLYVQQQQQLQQQQQQNTANNRQFDSLLSSSASSSSSSLEMVHRCHQQQCSDADQHSPADNDDSNNNNMNNDSCCSICLDVLSSSSAVQEQQQQEQEQDLILTLPCQHKFHYNTCIVPWLTKRQSKCPLCKYDVYEYVRNNYCTAIIIPTGNTNSSATTISTTRDNINDFNGIIVIPTQQQQHDDAIIARTIGRGTSYSLWNRIQSTISFSSNNNTNIFSPVSTMNTFDHGNTIDDDDDDDDVELTTTTTSSSSSTTTY